MLTAFVAVSGFCAGAVVSMTVPAPWRYGLTFGLTAGALTMLPGPAGYVWTGFYLGGWVVERLTHTDEQAS